MCCEIRRTLKTVVGPVSSDMTCKALNRSDDGKKMVSLPNKGWIEECNLIFGEEFTGWMDGWMQTWLDK